MTRNFTRNQFCRNIFVPPVFPSRKGDASSICIIFFSFLSIASRNLCNLSFLVRRTLFFVVNWRYHRKAIVPVSKRGVQAKVIPLIYLFGSAKKKLEECRRLEHFQKRFSIDSLFRIRVSMQPNGYLPDYRRSVPEFFSFLPLFISLLHRPFFYDPYICCYRYRYRVLLEDSSRLTARRSGTNDHESDNR